MSLIVSKIAVVEFETLYAGYEKDLEEVKKKRDYSKLKLLTAIEIVNKIVKGDKDFSNVRIFGVDWARRDLSGFNFSGSKIEWCVFSGCKIKNANFSNVFLDWCLFDLADLSKCNFKNSIVWNSGFLNANLTNVDFSNSDLRYVLLADIIGKTNFTNCIQLKIWYSIEELFMDKESGIDDVHLFIQKAGLPIQQALTFKVKINEAKSSTEKLKLFYDTGRQAFNPEGNLNLYSFKKVGKTSLGEYTREGTGTYTSRTEYGVKDKDRKKTDVYSR